MRLAFFALVLPFSLSLCDDSSSPVGTPSTVAPKPVVAAETFETVQRVDMGGKYRGPGLVVSPYGHVITALENLPEYVFWKYRVTVGSERVPGAIIAVDESLGLALIRAERPLRRCAVFTSRIDLKSGDPTVTVGFLDADGEPQMIERRQVPSTITEVHKRGESVGRLDLHDMTTVSLEHVEGRLHVVGSAVFTANPDAFVGMIVGSSEKIYGQSTPTAPQFVVPSTSVATFMRRNHAEPKTQ